MATETLEVRLTTLEKEMALVKEQLAAVKPEEPVPWWDQVYGSFADSEGFEEAVRLGREYRESQRMNYDEETESVNRVEAQNVPR